MLDISNMLEILYDIKDEGSKEIAWRKHHLITLRLAQAYKRLHSPKYKRIINCASYMEFRRYDDNSLRLQSANFCQTRLCPTCNWRRSRKIFAQVSRVMDSIVDDYKFIFLTLTVKNVDGAALSQQISKMVAAFKMLCLRKQFTNSIQGWVRCFEITYNWETKVFHPHFHCILAVAQDYFTSGIYITQEAWCSIWQQCLNVDYIPIVNIKAFTKSEKGKGKEVAEVAKYAVKSSNIMVNLQDIKAYSSDIQTEVKEKTDKLTDEIVRVLDSALAHRRLIGYGGIFKQKRRELALEDNIDDELVHAGNDSTRNGQHYEVECYRWDVRLREYIRHNAYGKKGN